MIKLLQKQNGAVFYASQCIMLLNSEITYKSDFRYACRFVFDSCQYAYLHIYMTYLHMLQLTGEVHHLILSLQHKAEFYRIIWVKFGSLASI